MTPGPSGAQCAIHAGVPAPTVCARCGNFMCLTCSENATQTQCPACRKLVAGGFPLDANAGVGQIWDYVLNRFKEEWVMLSVGILLFMAVAAVGGVFTQIISQIVNAVMGIKLDPIQPWRNMRDFLISNGITQAIAPFVQIPFQGIGLLGIYRLIVDVLYGRKADIGRMFKQMHLLTRYVIMQVVIHLMITIPLFLIMFLFSFVAFRTAGISFDDWRHSDDAIRQFVRSPAPFILLGGSMIFIVAAFLVAPITLFSAPELLVSECQPMEAISRAWKMGEGNRWRIFGYSMLSGFMVFVGFVACCVGVIPGTAAAYMLLVCLFLVVRKARTDLPPIVDK